MKLAETESLLSHFPVATLVHLLAVLALCIKWVAGDVSERDLEVFAVLLGSNSLLGVARGLKKR